MDWKDVNKELPVEYKKVVGYLKNVTTEGDDNPIIVSYCPVYKAFKRWGGYLIQNEYIYKKNKYPRFSDPYSCNDLDGDYCILTHWAYINEPNQTIGE